MQPVIAGISFSLRTDSDPLARGLSAQSARPLAEQTQALQRLLDGDIDSPFPETAGVRELDTIGRLMDAFRSVFMH